jgi:hypothetical protein
MRKPGIAECLHFAGKHLGLGLAKPAVGSKDPKAR